jgi:flagellar biosynthetic protein FlhB
MLNTCKELIRFFFERAVELDPTKDAIILAVLLRYFIRLAAPIMLVAFIAAIVSNVVQVGFLFTTKPIVPDFSKVLPKIGQYFKRIFSVDGVYNFVKSIAKMAIIGFVAFILIYSEKDKLLRLQETSIMIGLTTVSTIAIKMLIISAFLLGALSIPDLIFQRWRFRERNRMTRYEIKEEMKMYQMDPQIQGRIRSRFRELLKQNIRASVPKADVVITNPTHLAVALQWDASYMRDGPVVVAKGADEVAATIREIAKDHEIPLVENKPLAWNLYREADVGDAIPSAYFEAVGLIYSKIWYLNEERRRRRASA